MSRNKDISAMAGLLTNDRTENEVALQQAEMRMVRWMCNAKVKDRVPSKELKD